MPVTAPFPNDAEDPWGGKLRARDGQIVDSIHDLETLTGPVGRLGEDALNAAFARQITARGPVSAFDPAVMTGRVGPRLTTPTHDGSGEATHPSVVAFPEQWNGYRYWMGMTPYPNGAVAHEDPNILVSNDGTAWSVPVGLSNPLDNAPGGTDYNSDTDLRLGPDGRLWLFWRQVTSSNETIWVRKSADGVNWTAREMVLQTAAGSNILSPCFIPDETGWTVYTVYSAGATRKLQRRRHDGHDIVPGDWSTAVDCTLTGGVIAGKALWHLDVQRIDGALVALLTCTNTLTSSNAILQLATSLDGAGWVTSPRETIPAYQINEHDKLYRSTFAAEYIDGERVLTTWYAGVWGVSPTVWHIYRTVIRGPGRVEEVPTAEPVPAGLPPRTFIARTFDGTAEVARNLMVRPAPGIDPNSGWAVGYWGPGGSGTNLRKDTGGPVAEGGAPQWIEGTIDVAPASGQTFYCNIGSTAVSMIPVTPGETYVFSAYGYADFASVSSLRALFATSGGAAVGGEIVGEYYDHAGGAWARRAIKVIAPATAARVMIRFYFQNTVNPTAGQKLGASSLLAMKDSRLWPYFGGDLSFDPALVAGWAGSAWDSATILTADRSYAQLWDGVKAMNLS